MATASFEHMMILPCSCSIPLPRRSHLGTFESLECQPMGEWPQVFLCLRHGQAFECLPDSIHFEADMRLPGQRVSPLWRIECVCGEENCATRHEFYTGRMPNWDSILEWLLMSQPKVPCGDHTIVWKKNLIAWEEFAHESPMR